MHRRVVARAAAVALVGSLSLVLGPTQASAVGGNCSAAVEHQPRTGPDYYRARASCSSLQADSKARPVLDVWGPNSYGPWFTGLNTYYYSPWGDFVIVYGAMVQIAHV